MALSAFDDKSRPPRDDDLAVMLGSTFVFWNELKRLIASRFASLSMEWGFTSKKTGWGLRLKQGKRVILYMTPRHGYFLASFALGEKAVKAAHESDLPVLVLEVIDSARKYAEGRGVRLQVRTAEDVLSVEKLAVIKKANQLTLQQTAHVGPAARTQITEIPVVRSNTISACLKLQLLFQAFNESRRKLLLFH